MTKTTIDSEIERVEAFGFRSSGLVNDIVKSINDTYATGIAEQLICLECRDELIVDDRPASPKLHAVCCGAEVPDTCTTTKEDHVAVDDLVDIYFYKGYLKGLKLAKANESANTVAQTFMSEYLALG